MNTVCPSNVPYPDKLQEESTIDDLNNFEHRLGIKLHTRSNTNRFSDRLKAHKDELKSLGVSTTKPRDERRGLETFFDYTIKPARDFSYDQGFSARPRASTSLGFTRDDGLSVAARGSKRAPTNTAGSRANNMTIRRTGLDDTMHVMQSTRSATRMSHHNPRRLSSEDMGRGRPGDRVARSLSMAAGPSRMGTVRVMRAKPTKVEPASEVSEGGAAEVNDEEYNSSEQRAEGSYAGSYDDTHGHSSYGETMTRTGRAYTETTGSPRVDNNDGDGDEGEGEGKRELEQWEIHRDRMLHQFDEDPNDEQGDRPAEHSPTVRDCIPPAMLTRSAPPNRHSKAAAIAAAKTREPVFKPANFHKHETLRRLRGHISYLEPIFIENGPAPGPIKPVSNVQFEPFSSHNNVFDDLLKPEDRQEYGRRTRQAATLATQRLEGQVADRAGRLSSMRTSHLEYVRTRSANSRAVSAMLRTRLSRREPAPKPALPPRHEVEEGESAMRQLDDFDFERGLKAIW